jgi:gluconolactonase
MATPVGACIPQGSVHEFVFANSVIYPGTRRNCAVFIPAQYDASRPACIYVGQDGYQPRLREMLENLIAAGDIPVTVGIFISPGSLPAPLAEASPRRNRCLEYDALGDAYVRFLLDEIIPHVVRTFALNLSDSGNDRCIAGASSGGISAFNVAWERPDAFTRVYANSGSFVAFRGGHEFPTLVRKFAPKPIRAYLTTATRDMENCAGDWYLVDQEMDKALAFSGYDYAFKTVDGPHVAGWNECFADAMRFIWKGWPDPVRAGPGAPRVRDVIVPESEWELVSHGCRGARSLAANSSGDVFFIDCVSDAICRIDDAGSIGPFVPDAAKANGLAIGPQDEVYTVSVASGDVMRYDRSGPGRRIAQGIRGNHVLARPDGDLYITSVQAGAGSVVLLRDGVVRDVDAGLKSATGLAYRPDQWLMVVADGHSKWVYSYQIADDGGLVHKERYFRLHVADGDDDAGPESVCYAREGQMLVATRSGVQICADDGPTQVILPLPDRTRVVGICLGGPGKDTLYAMGENALWRRQVRIHGIGAFTPWCKVGSTPL